MPTIGDATKPNRDETEQSSSSYNQSAQILAMPERGRLLKLGGWSAGVNQTANARLCVWDAAGALLGQTAVFTMAGKAWAAGNVDKYEADLETPVELDAGVSFFVGISRDPNRSHQLTARATGGANHHFDNKRAAWPGTMLPNSNGDHGFGDYTIGMYVADYVAIRGGWIYRGGVWIRAESVMVYRAGSWQQVETVQIRRGASWTDAD